MYDRLAVISILMELSVGYESHIFFFPKQACDVTEFSLVEIISSLFVLVEFYWSFYKFLRANFEMLSKYSTLEF